MKKDKKSPDEALEQNPEALEKDYQKEEDEDVKEKHKLAKIIIAIILFIVIFFIILLIHHIKEESAEKFYDVDGKNAADAVAMADESDEIIAPDGCVLDLSGPTVTVTIPEEYFEGKLPADTLSESEIAGGYTDIKKIGGNVIYTIKTSYYPSIVSNLYEYHSDEYQDKTFLQENDVLRFAQYQYMQKFTVTLSEREFFSPNDYRDLLKHAYYQAAIYQCYLGIAPADINVAFQFKYIGAQYTFVEYNFPELLNKNLSSVAVNMREGTKPNSAASRFGFDEK